ncbi:hypothetical protein B0A48_17401 [Cryoendolithus antarcticus]|uniref:Zinc-ribbon 15 domain-containing protein n=1 Tax=Cryoendolithus antarcticus TaxID=1507870 RepID=A0A1V8SDE7_9PEZI|nr:hypothetical protein B0A48_17401 [Cryoendolithus antarcticus]
MAFIFTCGTHTFSSLVSGAEHITAQCQNCGNFSARVYKRWEWFTFCFVPLIPFSLKPYQSVGCHVCNFQQDIKFRPDVQSQMNGGAPPPGGPIPLQQQGHQGWSQGPPGGGGAPPQQYQQSGGQPVYK